VSSSPGPPARVLPGGSEDRLERLRELVRRVRREDPELAETMHIMNIKDRVIVSFVVLK